MAMWNDYEKIARRLDRIANAFERIANALETANIIEADRKTEPTTQMKTQNSNKNSNVISVYDGSETEPQTCDTCRYDKEPWHRQVCDECTVGESNWKPKDEPQTEREGE